MSRRTAHSLDCARSKIGEVKRLNPPYQQGLVNLVLFNSLHLKTRFDLTRSTGKPSALAPLILIALAVVCTPLLGLAEPLAGDQVAVVFPPGWSERDVLLASAEAGQNLVRFGALPNVGIVEFSSQADLQDLRAAGALLLLDPQVLGGCLIGADTPVLPSSHLTGTAT